MQTAQMFEIVSSVSSPNKLNFVELHRKAVGVSKDLRANYVSLFDVLLEVEEHRIYEQFEVPSLYLYCVELLELSPQITKDFMCVIRKSFEVPELASAVRSKRLTISKARKICSVITADDYKQWIELAESCSCRVIEKAVAAANPKAAIFESIKYVSKDVLEFKLGVTEEWADLLKQTKDLLSQKFKRAISSEEALLMLMADYCKTNDPVAKAIRAKQRNQSRELAFDVNELLRGGKHSQRLARHRPRDIPSAVAHSVNMRDKGQCTYLDARGKRCDSRRWLHLHHVNEFANGGGHEVDNLETLCSAHHKSRHLKIQKCHVTLNV